MASRKAGAVVIVSAFALDRTEPDRRVLRTIGYQAIGYQEGNRAPTRQHHLTLTGFTRVADDRLKGVWSEVVVPVRR
jgi:hypothetical protein